MSEHDHSTSHGNDTVQFEASDVSTRPVVYSVVALAAFTIIFTIAANYVYFGLAARQKALSPAASPLAEQYAAKEPPEPRLQLRPKSDLEALHASEDKVLSTLAWVDKDAGVVQVPIERAMQMLLAKGLPARQGEVPSTMRPHGDAPPQMAEAAGAPDWDGGWKISRNLEENPEHAGAHSEGSAAHTEGAAGHAEASGHGEANGR
jgi:hypothetical protein